MKDAGGGKIARGKSGQSLAEYLILTVAVLVVLIASGALPRIRTAFDFYFNATAESIK